MKNQIRNGVFETNSSSTHAICISKNKVDLNNLPSYVEFARNDFGWSFDVYTSIWGKASYLYEAILECYYYEAEEKLNHICEVLAKYGISCEFSSGDKYGGYIDHGYETIDFVNDVLNDEEKLMTYLFGDSFIVTGNDNSDDYSDYMYVNEGEESTSWGTFTNYGKLKPEFDNYEIYYKGN